MFRIIFLILIGILALPEQASANAGTPLMWAGMLHLLIGNLLIGILEGFLLARFFQVCLVRAIWIMILANYTSAWFGGLILKGAIVPNLPMDLNNGWFWFWLMVIFTFTMTLVIEWPFIIWAFLGFANRHKQSIRASFMVQSSSYILLFGWYWLASEASLFTKMDIVSQKELPMPSEVSVYFISPSDGDVYLRNLEIDDLQKIFDLNSEGHNDRLYIRPNAQNINRWDLMARLDTKDHNNPTLIQVLTNLDVDAIRDRLPTNLEPLTPEGTWFNFGEVPVLGDAKNSKWKFWTGFWPVEGLRGTQQITGQKLHFSYETPFGAWPVRNAVQLPTEKILFQLEDDQICGLDPESGRLALLWHGRGPVPVIERFRQKK